MRLSTPLLVVGMLAIALCFGATRGFASTYEWITGYSVSPLTVAQIHFGDGLKVYRTVNTSSSYEEYRTAYYQVTSTVGIISPADSGWIEWTECRAHSTVSTPVEDRCFPTVPTSSGIMYPKLHILVTTNYAGCGTYTANPGANCGDTTSTYRYYAP